MMSQKRNFVAALRPVWDLAHRWGLRSFQGNTWLPVFYPTEKEANAAVNTIVIAMT
jgi:hypothetical protein